MGIKPPLCLSFSEPMGTDEVAPHSLDVLFKMGQSASRTVSFSSNGAPLKRNGNALLCLGLVPALELGVDLVIDAKVDAELLDRCNTIQALLCAWYPGYRVVSITAPVARPARGSSQRTAVFFSGGVDSSYSLVERRDSLDALVTLIGADVDPQQHEPADHLRDLSKNVAEAFDIEQIVITTDIRQVSDSLVGWVEYHGALLSAVGHLLSDRLDHVLIASSADESSWNRRWGSHPALDPLWSTQDMQVEHHGLVHRLAKIERITSVPTLMNHLRVCNFSEDNCGVCPNCSFMLQALDLLDARSLSPTYAHGDSSKTRLEVTGEGSLSDMKHLRAAALERKQDSLVSSIDRALAIYAAKKRRERIFRTAEMARRFKRFKRQIRYLHVSRKGT